MQASSPTTSAKTGGDIGQSGGTGEAAADTFSQLSLMCVFDFVVCVCSHHRRTRTLIHLRRARDRAVATRLLRVAVVGSSALLYVNRFRDRFNTSQSS